MVEQRIITLQDVTKTTWRMKKNLLKSWAVVAAKEFYASFAFSKLASSIMYCLSMFSTPDFQQVFSEVNPCFGSSSKHRFCFSTGVLRSFCWNSLCLQTSVTKLLPEQICYYFTIDLHSEKDQMYHFTQVLFLFITMNWEAETHLFQTKLIHTRESNVLKFVFVALSNGSCARNTMYSYFKYLYTKLNECRYPKGNSNVTIGFWNYSLHNRCLMT